MRLIDLQEYVSSGPHPLSPRERDSLRGAVPSLRFDPVADAEGVYTLTPGSDVGAVEIGDLSVLIRPKIGIRQLLSLACYAIGMVKFRDTDFDFPEQAALPDALALAFTGAAQRAFSRGLLHDYRTWEETLYGVRGRIRFADQIRRRPGILLPLEVRYDEFTDDIRANQLVKAAAMRLGAMRLRSDKARRSLGWVVAMLDGVSLVEFPRMDVPEVEFSRLNEHYRGVVTLARLILRHGAFEARRGEVRASGFLMNMNEVFQEFVTVALREALGVPSWLFGEHWIASLDEGGRVGLKPDLVWRDRGVCVFVGDAKYKNITGDRVPNTDLYQLLAYTTALDLPSGLLVYAKGEADVATYTVRHSDKQLQVSALDLSGSLDDVLGRVGRIADCIASAVRGGVDSREPALLSL